MTESSDTTHVAERKLCAFQYWLRKIQEQEREMARLWHHSSPLIFASMAFQSKDKVTEIKKKTERDEGLGCSSTKSEI